MNPVMCCTACIAALLIGATTPLAAADDEEAATTNLRLRVMTYNIHHGVGMDGELDLPRIAGVINAFEPDVVVLQEVDVRTQRTEQVDQAARLGELTEMDVFFGRAIDYQGGEYGQAILSRHPMSDTRVHELPMLRPGIEQRIAVEATLDLGGGESITVVGTHLDAGPNAAGRIMQVNELNELFAGQSDKPVILMGDINDPPGSPPLMLLEKQWTNVTAGQEALTSPAPEPTRQIDFIFYRPANHWRVIEAKVVDEAVASDHRPLVAVLERVAPADE